MMVKILNIMMYSVFGVYYIFFKQIYEKKMNKWYFNYLTTI